MPSPFPGMNPYLEQEDAWHDFHERFLPAAAEVIGAQVQPHFIVKIDEHVYVHERPAASRRWLGRADLGITPTRTEGEPAPALGLIEAPVSIKLPAVDIEREAYLEVRDRRSRELVTVVELLSPANKRAGPDREQYLTRRRRVLASPAHLVEIDLLRGGAPMPPEVRPSGAYSALVSRVEDRPAAGLWPIGLRDRLPTIPIPLRPPHPDARLDLQAILHRVYEAAGYHFYIYDNPPSPALAPDDAAWCRSLLPPGAS